MTHDSDLKVNVTQMHFIGSIETAIRALIYPRLQLKTRLIFILNIEKYIFIFSKLKFQ